MDVETGLAAEMVRIVLVGAGDRPSADCEHDLGGDVGARHHVVEHRRVGGLQHRGSEGLPVAVVQHRSRYDQHVADRLHGRLTGLQHETSRSA